jgi:hypothetical protein
LSLVCFVILYISSCYSDTIEPSTDPLRAMA